MEERWINVAKGNYVQEIVTVHFSSEHSLSLLIHTHTPWAIVLMYYQYTYPTSLFKNKQMIIIYNYSEIAFILQSVEEKNKKNSI